MTCGADAENVFGVPRTFYQLCLLNAFEGQAQLAGEELAQHLVDVGADEKRRISNICLCIGA